MSATVGLIIRERIGSVLLLGINRPSKRNAINGQTAKELREAFEKFEGNNEEKVAVLYGTEGTFCAGYDLEEIASDQNTEDAFKSIENSLHGPMGPTRMLTKKPVIAAVNGYAVAGGLELALWCDMRVMEESAIMGVFCRRFGVPLIDGGTVRLPALIGLSRAMDLILTGRKVTGKEAAEIGLANRVVKDGTAIGTAVQIAQDISRFPSLAMLADRQSAYNATFSAPTLESALLHERDFGMESIKMESRKGASKFVAGEGRGGKFNSKL